MCIPACTGKGVVSQHALGRGVCIPARPGWVCVSQHALGRRCAHGVCAQVCMSGRCGWGLSAKGGVHPQVQRQTPSLRRPEAATAADGTHPTEMDSCLLFPYFGIRKLFPRHATLFSQMILTFENC